MAVHSVLVGGSIAERRIKCPASFTEQLKAPPGTTSDYAEHGTAMHEAMAHWLRNPDEDLVGLIFNDHIVTEEDVDTLLTPAWDALVDLQEKYGGGFRVTHLEKQVRFPGIAGAFGTADAILQSPTHFILADFKFGAGVFVPATYPDGEINSQLLFYLAGAASMAKKREMVVAIIQPAFPPGLDHAVVTKQNLVDFETKIHHALALATSPNPPRSRGEHCRFASCKLTCKEWTGPLLNLSAIGRPPVTLPPNQDWGVWLSIAKRLVDSAIQYQKEIDAALLEHLKGGGSAPGFALKPQVKNRKWLEDVGLVAKQLKRLGLPEDKIWQKKLQTFAVVDATAKKLGVTVPEELRPRPQSNGDLVLTYEGDPNAIDHKTIAVEFSAALKKLANQTG